MPTPPTLTFAPATGPEINLDGTEYAYLNFSDAWSAPQAEVDIIHRTQRAA